MSSEEVARTTIGGINVLVTDALPISPTDGVNARRMVRHAFANTSLDGMSVSILDWLGEDTGPKPGDPTHAMLIGNTLHASRTFARRLTQEAGQ